MHGPRQLARVGRGAAPVVGVVGGAVARDLAVDLRRAALARALEILHQQDRAALAGHVAVGAHVEGAVRGVRIVLRAQVAVAQLAGQRVGPDRRLEAAADDDVGMPRRIVRRECWSASRPPAPSAITTPQGPFILCRIEIWPVVAA